MDCMDCHNRPSHRFDSTPERAVNEALATGALPASLPFVRREAVAALKATYPSQEAALAGIAKRLTDFYAQQLGGPGAPRGRRDVARAVAAAQGIYRPQRLPGDEGRPGAPTPNNIGHVDFPGCFRCHDDAKKTPRRAGHQAGLRTLPQDGVGRSPGQALVRGLHKRAQALVPAFTMSGFRIGPLGILDEVARRLPDSRQPTPVGLPKVRKRCARNPPPPPRRPRRKSLPMLIFAPSARRPPGRHRHCTGARRAFDRLLVGREPGVA